MIKYLANLTCSIRNNLSTIWIPYCRHFLNVALYGHSALIVKQRVSICLALAANILFALLANSHSILLTLHSVVSRLEITN